MAEYIVEDEGNPGLGLFQDIDDQEVTVDTGVKLPVTDDEEFVVEPSYSTSTISQAKRRDVKTSDKVRVVTRTTQPKNDYLEAANVGLDIDLMKESDKPSKEIIGEDKHSDPEVDVTVYNTTMTVETNDTPTSIVESITSSDTTQEYEPVKANIELNMDDEEDFEIGDEDETTPEVSVVEEIKTITEEPVETKKTSVVAKPISVEDENIDLNISTIGKEEVKPASIDVNDAFEIFDTTTPETKYTEQEMTEIVIPNISDEQFGAILAKLGEVEVSGSREAKRNIAAKVSNKNSIESRIVRSTLFGTDRQKLEQASLQNAIDEKHNVYDSIELDGVTYKDKKTAQSQLNRLENGSIIDSKDSFALAMALIGGVRKVHFYNSGFWVTVRPPLIRELHTYYTRCGQNAVEYGRIFGQLSYLPADVEITRAGLDLFKGCIMGSNLENCKIDDTFERNLSVADEDTYLWALASLMFPEGTEIEYACSNENCHHIDRVNIDLAKLRYFDYSRLGVEALKFCHDSTRRTDADLIHYRDNILKVSEIYSLDEEWSVKVSEPTLYDVLVAKSSFVDEMAQTLQLSDYDEIDNYISARYFKILAPWISQVSFTRRSDGKRIYFNDRYGIDKIVDALQLKFDSLPEIVTKHKNKTKISYYCYSYTKCPVCGSVPPAEIDGLIPCDMQQSFFTLTTELLK